MDKQLHINEQRLEETFHAQKNCDFNLRRFRIADKWAFVCYIEGMADEDKLNEFVLKQVMSFPDSVHGTDVEQLYKSCIAIAGAKSANDMDEIVKKLLDG